MSAAKTRIIRQAESQGWTVTSIEWEPVGAGAEKAGPSGGWEIELERGDEGEWAGGYNEAQVTEWIRNLDRPLRTDPFSCSGKYHSLAAGDCGMARGHRGEHWPVDDKGRLVPR